MNKLIHHLIPSRRRMLIGGAIAIVVIIAAAVAGGAHHPKAVAARSVPVQSVPAPAASVPPSPSTTPPPTTSAPSYPYTSVIPSTPGEYRTKWGIIIFQRAPQGFMEPTPQSYNLAIGDASNRDLNVCTDLSNVQDDLNSTNGGTPQMAAGDAQTFTHDGLADGGPLGDAFRWYLDQFQAANPQSSAGQNAALSTLLNGAWGICTTYQFSNP